MSRFTPRPYQQAAIDDAVPFLLSSKPGDRRLYSSPTGTGKSIMEIGILDRVEDAWIVTPRREIAAGLLDKMGVEGAGDLGEAKLWDVAAAHRITSPVRVRNALLGGRGECPGRLVIDEAHHDSATTYRQLHQLTGRCPAVGFTATPFRGTPKGTAQLREDWGEPVTVISLRESITEGVLSFPNVRIVPLVDDEEIEIVNGEFKSSSVSTHTEGRLAAAVEVCRAWCVGGRWDRPTMASMPSVETAQNFTTMLIAAGLPADCVTGETLPRGRQFRFDRCIDRGALLVQVAVVSEGVDLPVRRLLDLSPSISPVRWLQQLGRITRPVGAGESPPEYVCTNRNLLRHAYLLEGCLPPAALIAAVEAFPQATRTTGTRVVGLEAMGRLQPATVKLRDGLEVLTYAVSAVEGATVTQYAVIVHPLWPEPLWARRTNTREEGVTAAYGTWQRCEPPADLTGYTSLPGSPITEKQAAWWKRSAGTFGLDATVEPTRKTFSVLPVLSDLRRQGERVRLA